MVFYGITLFPLAEDLWLAELVLLATFNFDDVVFGGLA